MAASADSGIEQGKCSDEIQAQNEQTNKNSGTDGTIEKRITGDDADSQLEGEVQQGQQQQSEQQHQVEQEAVGDIRPIGKGVFGNIYDQFRGKAREAINFLLQKRDGEALGALSHPEIGDIDLVWGTENYGLMKIAEKHPEVLSDLQGILDNTKIVSQSDNRIVLESDTHKVIISKKIGDLETNQWLLTAYEKKNAAVSANSSDNETEPKGKQIDTATLQNSNVSDGKDTTLNSETQGKEGKLAEIERRRKEEYNNLVDNRISIDWDSIVYDPSVPGNKRNTSGSHTVIDYAGRKIVVININGRNIPFYLSTGHGGKADVTSGKWYPVFGISESGWLNKLSGKEINNYYGSNVLKGISEALDRKIGDIRNDESIPKVGATGKHFDVMKSS